MMYKFVIAAKLCAALMCSPADQTLVDTVHANCPDGPAFAECVERTLGSGAVEVVEDTSGRYAPVTILRGGR